MKSIKVLMLIIATDIFLLYRNLISILRAYLPFYKGNVEYYFLHARPEEDSVWKGTENDYKIIDDCLYIKGQETFRPGILDKTIKGMKIFNLDNYDFFIRTNLSSFFVLDKFLQFLSIMPRRNFYCSQALSWTLTETGEKFYGSGSIIILSSDCAKFLCRDDCVFEGKEKDFDDIVIGRELWYRGGYKLYDLPFTYNIFDITETPHIQQAADSVPENTIYIKVRNDKVNTPRVDKRLIFDTEVLRIFLRKYYNLDITPQYQ